MHRLIVINWRVCFLVQTLLVLFIFIRIYQKNTNFAYEEHFSNETSWFMLIFQQFEHDTVLIPKETSWFGYYPDGTFNPVLPPQQVYLLWSLSFSSLSSSSLLWNYFPSLTCLVSWNSIVKMVGQSISFKWTWSLYVIGSAFSLSLSRGYGCVCF